MMLDALLLLHRNETTKQRRNTMFKVEITYKSGKVEIANINISEYSAALTQLSNEGRLVKMIIIS